MEQTMDYANLSAKELLQTFDLTLLNASRIRSIIAAALPAVQAESRENYRAIAAALEESS
jgi:hypothetical protein